MSSCCQHCFQDPRLQGIIAVSGARGDCDFCGATDTEIYDLQQHDDIQRLIAQVCSLYELDPNPSQQQQPYTVLTALCDTWQLFNLSHQQSAQLLQGMYGSGKNGIFGIDLPAMLHESVHLRTDDEQPEQLSWDNFTDQIKHHNRFFPSIIDFKHIAQYITHVREVYDKGTILTRARIAPDSNGFKPEEMGAPPRTKASAGRINPAGISELYTTIDTDKANADDTAVHEIRAGMHDFVSFGKFELTRDITIIDLTRISTISPFDFDSDDLMDLAVYKDILNGMANDISKPLRRSDSPLEYVPSQYIAEFIKSIDSENDGPYDGVKYNSTLQTGGVNLCLFDPETCHCIDVYTKQVSEIAYSMRE